jgi:hypothetical protein
MIRERAVDGVFTLMGRYTRENGRKGSIMDKADTYGHGWIWSTMANTLMERERAPDLGRLTNLNHKSSPSQ